MAAQISSGLASLARPVVNAATKTAKAAKVKAVSVKVKAKIKKKVV